MERFIKASPRTHVVTDHLGFSPASVTGTLEISETVVTVNTYGWQTERWFVLHSATVRERWFCIENTSKQHKRGGRIRSDHNFRATRMRERDVGWVRVRVWFASRLIGHWSQVSCVLQIASCCSWLGACQERGGRQHRISHAGNNGHYVPPAVRTDMPWVS